MGWKNDLKEVILQLALGLTLVLSVQAAVSPKFRDVSIANGLLSYDEMDKRLPYDNKYWGASVADVNRDGKYDLFMSNHGNNPEFYIAKDSGGFQHKDPRLYGRDIHSSCVADMDNDGYLDVVVITGGSRGNNVVGTPIVHLGNTKPVQFKKSTGASLGLGEIPMRGRSLSFLDVNADGYLDLLFVNERNVSAIEAHLLYENLGNGRFILRKNSGIEGVGGLWFALIDANDDSYLDILFMKFKGMELWLGTGDFKFKEATQLIPNGSELTNVRAATEIDYDGDGDLDLILARGHGDGHPPDVLLEKTSSGYVTVPFRKTKIPRLENNFHITVGDLDNDGFMDMYVSRVTKFEAPRLNDFVLINNGNKKFFVASNTGTETAGTDTDGDNAMIVDFDMDGRPDLLVGSRNSEWKLYKNTTPRGSRHYVHVRVGSPRAELALPEWFRRKSLGALVKVFCGGKTFLARVGSPGQSHSQSYMDTLHFGLGSCTNLQRIEVHYTGNVLVTRRNGLSVDQLIEVGMYFPCPAGFVGRNCNKEISACSTVPCAPGAACEVAKLARDKCDEERCRTGGGGTELLVNGDFEGEGSWRIMEGAVFTSRLYFDGSRSIRLRSDWSGVTQKVSLEGNRKYTLTCKILGGPVRYKIFENNRLFAQDPSEARDNTGKPQWKAKSMIFRTDRSGLYRIQLDTAREQSGSIDGCSLKRSGSRCNNACLKVHCPV